MPVGSAGVVEVFLPPGGTAGQVLAKIDTADYNATWSNGGGGGGGAFSGVSAGTTNVTTGGLSFSNSPTVSFGMNGSTITASANVAGGGTPFGVSAGTQSVSTGTVNFANSNGISFGMSNSSQITASYTVPSTAGLISAINVSAGTTSNNLTAFTLSNSNGLAFGLNGSVVTGSYTVPTQSTQPVALSGSNGSFAFSTASFGNSNGATFYTTNGSMVVSYTVPSTAGLISAINLSAGTTSQNLTAFTLSNSNGLAFGLNGSVVTGSYTVPTVTNSSWTASDNATSLTIGRLAFTNLNGLTLSLSTTTGGNATVVGSYTVPSTAGLISAVNVSAGTTSNNLTAFTLSNSNGLAFGLNGSVVTGSYTVPTVTNSSWTVSDANSSATVARLAFTNQNGLTLSLSTGAGGSHTIVGSYTVPTVTDYFSKTNTTFNGTNISGSLTLNTNGLRVDLSVGAGGAGDGVNIIAAGTQTANTTGSVLFQNSNGISFGMSNSSVVTASYTVPTVTNSSWTVSDNGTSGTVARLAFTNLNGVTLSLSTGANGSHTIVGSHNALTSQSNQAFSAAGGSSAFQTLGFSDNAHLSFTNSNGSVAAAPIKATLYAVSNTTQSSSGTQNLSALSFAGAGIASVGVTNGSVVVSVPSGGGAGDGYNIVQAGTTGTTGTTWSSASATVFLNGSNLTVSQNNSNQIVLSAPATSSLVGTGLVSVSTNGSTISVGVPGVTASLFNPPSMWVQSTSVAVGNGSVFVQPCEDKGEIFVVSRFNVWANMSISSSSNSSHAGALSFTLGIYTRTGSTLSLHTSGSQSYQWTNTSNNSMASISSVRQFSVPMNMTFTGGDYWIAVGSRSSTTNANWFTAANMRASIWTAQNFGLLGEASNSTKQYAPGFGLWSTTSTALPSSIAFSDIRGNGAGAANNALPFVWNAHNLTA